MPEQRAGKRPPALSTEERQRRSTTHKWWQDGLVAEPPRQVTMTVVMDDVPGGEATNVVNGGRAAGDCMRACVASVLDLDPDYVPHFVQYVEHPSGTDSHLWWWALVGFLHVCGWDARYEEDADDPPKGWALADGISPRGHAHVVVAYDGEVVYDPHPSRAGLTEVIGWIGLTKAQPERSVSSAVGASSDGTIGPGNP